MRDHDNNVVAHLSCGVPVDVVGYPVRQFAPADVDFSFNTSFNFLTVALWGQRKNIVKTIQNFVEEFHDEEDVGLILKTSFSSGSTYDKLNTRTAIQNILSKYPDKKCSVYLLHGRLSDEEMASLYNHDSVKCMLSLAHGEGFGLPLFESACAGLPIVATDWSGQTDFLYANQTDKKGKVKKKGLFGKVSYDLQKVQREAVWENIITPDSMWAYPKDASAKKKMREVFSNYDNALSRAKKLKEFVNDEFNSEKMHQKFIDSLFTSSFNDTVSFDSTGEQEGFLGDVEL